MKQLMQNKFCNVVPSPPVCTENQILQYW
jgi:hypothetical protein